MGFNKKAEKHNKSCIFCGEDEPAVLDAHRITPGEDGGKYKSNNVVICCSTCHRKIHANIIKIDRWYYNSNGNHSLHCWIGGEEKFMDKL